VKPRPPRNGYPVPRPSKRALAHQREMNLPPCGRFINEPGKVHVLTVCTLRSGHLGACRHE
jgi:hypothetical protein